MAVQSPWPTPEIPETDLTSFVLRHAERLADKPALIDGPSGRALTYGALVAGVERAAGGLTARGFGPGDVLALHLPNLPEFPIALHAGLRAGGVVTAASPLFTVPELGDQLRRARARIVVTVGPLADATRAAAAQAGTPEVLDLGELLAGGGELPATRPDPGEVALLLPSSGTTGLPKLVELTHRALVANLIQTQIPYPSGEDQRLLGLAPFFHAMGLSCVLHHGLANGATVVSLARLEMEALFRAMAEHRVTHALVPPPLLMAIANADADLSALRMLGVGGAPVTAAQEEAAAERLGVLVGQGYGMTEAGPLISVAPLAEPERLRHGTAGVILPGTEVQIV
jgi:acyl-CoA synthetase (AMP-forming)/AMP-acid ligase II